MMTRVTLILLLFGSYLCGTSFAAPTDFPKKEVTIIVNYGPGGARDVLARGIANTMSKYLKVPVVIMNEPGAGGARGLISLYHAAPDGYTIGIGTLADIISQILEKQEFDCKTFTYIGNAQHTPPIWSVRSDSPIRSTKDFKTYGKVVRHSAFSVTSNSTVAAMIVANRENFPLVIVGGYKSAADAILAVIRGEVEFSSCAPSVAAQYLKSGQLRPILAIDDKRPAGFPNIPTVAEAGHPDLAVLGTDYWVMAPPRLPKDRFQILEEALMKTLEDPDFLKWAKGANVDPSPLDGEGTTKKVISLFSLMEQYKGDIEKYSKQ
jgi:tripartite-type tricarboxylate transporter receptor subunit TctC